MNHVAAKVRINFRSEEPIYLQIARQIEEMVKSGDLNIGSQLPTVREMATELSINFNTVARAYRLLDEARLISTQRGRGTYIWEKPTEETSMVLKEEALENLLQKFIVDTGKLGFSVEEALAVLEKIRSSDRPIENQEKE